MFPTYFPSMHWRDFIGREEGKTLEYKRDLSSPKGVIQTLVAFANTAGGHILIGIEDKTKHVVGIKDPLLVEERLNNLIADQIEPPLVPTIEIGAFRNQQVLIIEVYLSSLRPHYLKAKTKHKGTYVRLGSSNRLADVQLVEELERSAQNRSFDEMPLPHLNSEAVNFRVASELFSPKRVLAKRDLETLGAVLSDQGKVCPSVGGFLLFSADPTIEFPDAWIQCGRFDGTDKNQILDQQDIRCGLIQALFEAETFIDKHNDRVGHFGGLQRYDAYRIPKLALRELLVNAVVHADYSQRGAPIRIAIYDDRITIENPGILVAGLDISDLVKGVSRLRNRVFGRVYKELNLIEQWGSGISRANAACKEQGLPTLEFKEIANRFRVTIYLNAVEAPTVDVRDQKILKFLNEHEEGLSTKVLSERIGLSDRATRSRLKNLLERGFVQVIGTSSNDPHRVFRVIPSKEMKYNLGEKK